MVVNLSFTRHAGENHRHEAPVSKATRLSPLNNCVISYLSENGDLLERPACCDSCVDMRCEKGCMLHTISTNKFLMSW